MGIHLITPILSLAFILSFTIFSNIYISFAFTAAIFIIFSSHAPKKIPFLHSPNIDLPPIEAHPSLYLSAIVSLLLFLLLSDFIGTNASIFTAFFLFAHLNKLTSHAAFAIAFVFLALTILIYATPGTNGVVDDIAVLVYYFLIIGLIWQLIESRSKRLLLKKQ